MMDIDLGPLDIKNKTKFNRGDKIGYEGFDLRLLVVGENESMLHTFNIAAGGYFGVTKLSKDNVNIECLVLFELTKERINNNV